MSGKQRTPLAQRLVQSAAQAGLTSEQLAERLGVAPSTVYSWRTGRNEPPLAMLVAWANAVGCSISWLATGTEDPVEQPARFAEWVLEFTERVMAGESPLHALDGVTAGQSGLSARERKALSRRARAMRGFIEEIAGRPWAELTEEERRQVVDRLLVMADEP